MPDKTTMMIICVVIGLICLWLLRQIKRMQSDHELIYLEWSKRLLENFHLITSPTLPVSMVDGIFKHLTHQGAHVEMLAMDQVMRVTFRGKTKDIRIIQ